jgi:hypothetical protein
MILTPLGCITRCSSSTSISRGGTGIRSSCRVNYGYVGHNEAAREDSDDVTAIFAIGWGSIPESIHGGLASSAHTSATSNSAPGLKKHIMAQHNCYGAGSRLIFSDVVCRWCGRAGLAVASNRRCAMGHLGEAEAMAEGTCEGSIGEGEGP